MIPEHSLILSWIGIAAALLIVWRASGEKPRYEKTYRSTRADGAFSTAYVDGFENYLFEIEDEVPLRMTVGLIAPVDDLHAELYHPELEENWIREFDRNHSIKEIVDLLLSICIIALAADGVVSILTGHFGFLQYWGTGQEIFERLVGLAFAAALYGWLYRRRGAITQTQGYLDGYSDGVRQRTSKAPLRSEPGL